MRKQFCILILLCSFICLSKSVFGNNEKQVEKFLTAQKLVDEGKHDLAWDHLMTLLSDNPDSILVNNLMVETAFATGRFNQAVGALERLIYLAPQNAKLHLTLAKAYARSGDEDSAKSELETAESLQPGISKEFDKEDLEKMAKMEQERYERFKASGRLAMGIIYDSNPTGGLDSLDIGIGNWTFYLNDEAGKKPSWGEYINGSLNWNVNLGDDSPFYIAGDVAFYGKRYDKKLPSNQTFKWGRFSIGPRYLSQKSMLEVKFKEEEAILDPKDCLNIMGGDLTWIYALMPNLQFIARAGLDQRTYWDREDYNGTYWNGGGYLRYFLGNSGDYSVMAGGRLLGAKAKSERYSYDGWEISGKFDMTFFKKLDITPYISWREQNYHKPATFISEFLGEENRKDNTLGMGVSTVYHWNDWLATEIGYDYSKNHSSSQFYRYDQHQFNMGMVVSF